MRGHAHRQGRERPESGEVGRLEFRARGVDHRELKVTVRRRPAVTRQVLEHRQYAAGHQARGDRPANGRDLLRRVAVGTVADYRIAATQLERRQSAGNPHRCRAEADRWRSGDRQAKPPSSRRHDRDRRLRRRRRRRDSAASVAGRNAARDRLPDRPEQGRREPTASRQSPISRPTCSGVSMLRANRMKPHGSASRRNDRSAALSVGPLTPVMNARASIDAD